MMRPETATVHVFPSSKMHLGMQIESMLKDADTGCQVTNILRVDKYLLQKVKVVDTLVYTRCKRYSIYEFSTISKNLNAIEECSEKNDLQVYSSSLRLGFTD